MLLCAWIAAAGVLLHRGWIEASDAGWFVSGYVLSMLWMSPDLDLADTSAYVRWGRLRWLWRPYAAVFRHRGLSHSLLLGPLTRIIYIGLLVFLGLMAYFGLSGAPGVDISVSLRVLAPVCVGLYLPNAEHALADRAVTAWRRKWLARTRL